MQPTSILLIPGHSEWRIGISNAGADRTGSVEAFRSIETPAADPETVAAQVAAFLKDSGYQGEDVVLAIPGAWCLAAALTPVEGKPRRHDALPLQLEEQLPISAEEFVADFVHADEHVLGIAVRLDLLAPTVSALEARQVHIAHIVPLTLLGLQRLASQLAHANACVLWQDADTIDVMRLHSGRLISWSTIPADGRELITELSRLSLEQPFEAVSGHIESVLAQELAAQGWTLAGFDHDKPSAALEMAGRITAGTDRPMI